MENPQLMAEKRKQQLKQSLEHLGGRFEDVIFIGDMNWNDSRTVRVRLNSRGKTRG